MNDAKEVLVVVNDPSTVAVVSADEVAGNAGATPAPASDTPEVKATPKDEGHPVNHD